jgi:branched-chain amino acid transport system permease protein
MLYLTSAILSLPLIGAYAIYAIGIVMIYRASRVLNLAHGVMATIPAYLLYTISGAGVPLVLALPLAIAGGGGLGWLVERVFVRAMRDESPTAQTVGTVVVLGFGVALTAQLWGTSSRQPVQVFPEGFVSVGRSGITFGQIGLFFAMLAIFGLLTLLFRYTDLGLLMRGAAENPRAAALMGVNPDRMTALTWVVGGALAGLAGIMLAANSVLQPYTLPLGALPGFLAALLGGLGSITGAVGGGLIVGFVIGMVPVMPGLGEAQGAPQLLLVIVAMVVMAMRGKQLTGAGAS